VTELRHIVRKELQEFCRQPGTLGVAASVGVLFAVTTIGGVPQHRAAEQWKAEATREVRQQWITQGTRHPHSAAHYGVIAFRPLESVALIEPGVSAYVGQMLPLHTHQRAFPTYAPSEVATSATRLGTLSPALLSLTIISLMIILAGYGALTRERESGTLGMLLAGGVSPGRLLAGKVAAVPSLLSSYWC
jgi:ABC-2 type transport system permease protein